MKSKQARKDVSRAFARDMILCLAAGMAIFAMLFFHGCTEKDKPAPVPSITTSPTPISSPVPSQSPVGLKPRLPALSTYLTYYGNWTAEAIAKAKRFPLVIAKQGTSAEEVQKLKSAGAIVVLYVSVGEHDISARVIGDRQGPMVCEGGRRVLKKKGVASYYAINGDGNEQGGWGSWYTDAGHPEWQKLVLAEARDLIAKGADGIFLDTVDAASPNSDSVPCTAAGMAELITKLHQAMPTKYLISNRGLFFLDPSKSTYSPAFRQAVSAVMFENFYTSWENDHGVKSEYWQGSHLPASKYVQAEALKPDGFTVLVLDYFARSQLNSSLLRDQHEEVAKIPSWVNSIGDYDLTEIYETLLPTAGGAKQD